MSSSTTAGTWLRPSLPPQKSTVLGTGGVQVGGLRSAASNRARGTVISSHTAPIQNRHGQYVPSLLLLRCANRLFSAPFSNPVDPTTCALTFDLLTWIYPMIYEFGKCLREVRPMGSWPLVHTSFDGFLSFLGRVVCAHWACGMFDVDIDGGNNFEQMRRGCMRMQSDKPMCNCSCPCGLGECQSPPIVPSSIQ